jgi:cytoskeletal protein RodZ
MRERTWLLGAFWSIACICLGSVLVWGYVFVELMKTQPGTPLITFVMGAADSTGRPSSSSHRLAKKTSKGKSKSKDTDDEQRDEAGALKH